MQLTNLKDCLLSAAIGDICGSPWEFAPNKNLRLSGFRDCMEFDYSLCKQNRVDGVFMSPLIENAGFNKIPHYPGATDDSICTFAIAEAVIEGLDITKNLQKRCLQEFNRGYGGMFRKWIISPEPAPYGSYGNGSAMRCSIAGWYPDSIDKVIKLAMNTAEPTHNHPEGIKGAVVTASAIFAARTGKSKEEVVDYILSEYPDWKGKTFESVHPEYRFDVSCQGSVPMAALCLQDSNDFEECIYHCAQSGGDSDTLGAIVAPIAFALYKEMPDYMHNLAERYLPQWCFEVNEKFNSIIGF